MSQLNRLASLADLPTEVTAIIWKYAFHNIQPTNCDYPPLTQWKKGTTINPRLSIVLLDRQTYLKTSTYPSPPPHSVNFYPAGKCYRTGAFKCFRGLDYCSSKSKTLIGTVSARDWVAFPVPMCDGTVNVLVRWASMQARRIQAHCTGEVRRHWNVVDAAEPVLRRDEHNTRAIFEFRFTVRDQESRPSGKGLCGGTGRSAHRFGGTSGCRKRLVRCRS